MQYTFDFDVDIMLYGLRHLFGPLFEYHFPLHERLIFMGHVGNYTSPMGPIGLISIYLCLCCVGSSCFPTCPLFVKTSFLFAMICCPESHSLLQFCC